MPAERKSRRIDSQASATSPMEFSGGHAEPSQAAVASAANGCSLKRCASNAGWGAPDLCGNDEPALQCGKRHCLGHRMPSVRVPSLGRSLPGVIEQRTIDLVATVAASAKRKASASPPRPGGSTCGVRWRAPRPEGNDPAASSRRYGVMDARRRLVRELGGL